MPDRVERVTVRGPSVVNGILYVPLPDQNSISREHWFYKQYPNLVLALADTSRDVLNVYNLTWGVLPGD